ncbi:cellulose synthase-like protein G2-like [Hibiscus syriacus]|uniref:Cellulose synthase-like protein G2-like n=1 Tax=Hibiscus syriacus TaxID=106335 RepID=A0A6A3B117_HIBSY|nr:cellulose synthase-like protein G2-like [Hibiscus syriacus]
MKVGNGDSILFWHEAWLDGVPLKSIFQGRIFCLAGGSQEGSSQSGFIKRGVQGLKIHLFRFAGWFRKLFFICLFRDPFRFVSWSPPPPCFVKVNVDGAMERMWLKGGIGGLLRDEKGVVLGSFLERVGSGPPILAELMTIKRRLMLFLESGMSANRRLILESCCGCGLDRESCYHHPVAKQKRNNRKSKDKGKEKAIVAAQEKHQEDHPNDEKEASVMGEEQQVPEKVDVLGDVSDSVDAATEVLQPDSEDRDASPVNWDTDTSEIHPPAEACTRRISGQSCVQNGVADRRSPSLMDDSSSTCSTDSVPSVVMNGPYKGNSFSNHNKKSLSRGRNQRNKTVGDGSSWTTASDNRPSCPALDAGHQNDVSGSSKAGESESEPAVSFSDLTKWSEQDTVRKEVLPQKKPDTLCLVDLERPEENTAAVPSSPRSPSRILPSSAQFRSDYRSAGSVDSMPDRRKALSNCLQQSDQPASSTISVQITGVLKSETQKAAAPKPIEKHTTPLVPVMSRPSSAPLIPGSRPIAPVVSMVQTAPLLARTVSAVGHLGPDPSPAASYVPQSYRNAIMGNHNVASSSAGFTRSNSPSSAVNPLPVYTQPPTFVSTPMYMPQSYERMEANSIQSGIPFGMVNRETFRNAPHWMEGFHGGSNRSMHSNPLLGEIENLDLYNSVHNGSREHFLMEFPACTSGHPTLGVLADEFPHLDIINELLDEEHNVPTSYSSSSGNHFDTPREFIPQASHLPYANGQQIDGLVPNRWQMASTDPSLVGMRNGDGESYPYYNLEYSILLVASMVIPYSDLQMGSERGKTMEFVHKF